MIRFIVSIVICLTLLPVLPAHADITQKFTLNYMRPYNTDAEKVSTGNFGASWEMEFHLEGVPDFISWGAGIDWIDLLGERSSYNGIVHEVDQNYFRLWFGPRLRSHTRAPVRPYIGVQASLVLYEYSASFINFFGEEEFVDRDFGFAAGYGYHGGIEIRVSPGVSLELSAKYLKTFGEPRQLSFDSVTVYPSYFLYQVGVRVTDIP